MSVNNIERFNNYNIDQSITVIGNVSTAVDYNTPLEFKNWLTYFKDTDATINTYKDSYRKYIVAWNGVKNNFLQLQSDDVKEYYVNLVKNISLDVFTAQERNFLNALNYDDPEQLDAVVPLVSQKIKSLTNYYKDFREIVKTQPKRNNIFSSNIGIKEFINQLINDLLHYNSDTQTIINVYQKNPNYILDNINITIEELYDEYDQYFDLSAQEPVSAYTSGGKLRTNYWNANTNPWDFDLFINYDKSVVRLLSSYNYILDGFVSNLSIPVSLVSSDTQYLKNKDFILQYNTDNIYDLNLQNRKLLFEKYSGSDWYYLSTTSTGDILSGVLFEAENPSANYLNRNNVSTATAPSTAFLVRAKDIGGFYTPNNLGVLIYNTFSYNYTLKDSLSANTVYYFPDPNKYLNTYGNSIYTRTGTIYDISENAYIVNYDISNSAAFGYINDRSEYLNFHGYVNKEEKLKLYTSGISKQYDRVDFFKGKTSDVWANADVFAIKNKTFYPIDERQNTLTVTYRDLINSTSDVYGNSYGLYKQVKPLLFENFTTSTASITQRCLFLSNGLFLYEGSDFDFSTSTGTVTDILPGIIFSRTGVELPAVNLTDDIAPTLMYGVYNMPWCYSTGITYSRGDVYDGTFYTNINGNVLPDTPTSDSPSWDINSQAYYYNILLDGGSGVNGQRPNWANLATFLVELSASIDGGLFNYYPASDPFTLAYVQTNPYNIPFYTASINSLSTTYVSIDNYQKKSIYNKKYELSAVGYVRDNNNYVSPLSAALSSIFVKYTSTDIYNELNNEIIKFDIIYDVAIIQTPNYIVYEKLNIDSVSNKITTYDNSTHYITRTTQGVNSIEQFGNFYYHERSNTILFNRLTLLGALSASNYRTMYPTFYKLELDGLEFKQIFPIKSTNQFGTLSSYSLRSVIDPYDNGNLLNDDYYYNVSNVDRPSLSYDIESNTYAYTIKTTDLSGGLAIFYQTYKFINGKFTNDINEVYFQNGIIRDENYFNPLTATFISYNSLAGTTGSTWINNEGVLKFGE